MSGQADAPEELALFRSNLSDTYITYALFALVAFEYLLTLPFEVKLWTRQARRRWSISAVLFLASRYLMVAIAVLDIFPYTEKGCAGTVILQRAVDILTFLVLTVFATIRVYAVHRRGQVLPFFIALSGLLPIAIFGYIFAHESTWYRSDPVLGTICDFTVELPANLYFPAVVVFTRLGFIIMDSVVLGVTVAATARHISAISRLNDSTTLSATLLRDGSLYFIMLVVTNVADILVNVPPAPHVTNPVGAGLLVIHPLLVSRFLMNLQTAYYGDSDSNDALGDELSTNRFSTLDFEKAKLGARGGTYPCADMGVSLAYCDSDADDEEYYEDETEE